MPKSKRSSRSRRRRRNRNTAIQRLRYFPQKCTHVIEVTADNAGSIEKTWVFSRYDYAGIVQSVYGINSPVRFNMVRGNYEQYAVTGFKLTWVPTNVTGNDINQPTGVIRPMSLFEDIDTYNVSGYNQAQIVALETFRLK